MLLFFLFATGLFAGTVDAIAGGGGLITLPILLSTGMPPHIAYGTSKLQAIVGTSSAVKHYHKKGLISFNQVFLGLSCGFVGSMIGATLAQWLSSQLLLVMIPILLAMVLLYTLLSPALGVEDASPRMNEEKFYSVFGLSLGFYDGFFGPGVGSLWVFFLTFFLGYNLIKATAYTKVLNLNSSTIATVCFMVGGNVDYRIALCMAAGQMLGGKLGARLAVQKGARLIRPLFIIMVTSTIGVLIYRSHLVNDVMLKPLLLLVSILVSGLVLHRYRRNQVQGE